MATHYKGYWIHPAVDDRPDGVPYTPRAVIAYAEDDAAYECPCEFPGAFASKAEAAAESLRAAKALIDRGAF